MPRPDVPRSDAEYLSLGLVPTVLSPGLESSASFDAFDRDNVEYIRWRSAVDPFSRRNPQAHGLRHTQDAPVSQDHSHDADDYDDAPTFGYAGDHRPPPALTEGPREWAKLGQLPVPEPLPAPGFGVSSLSPELQSQSALQVFDLDGCEYVI